jgi:Domain of unknown function (DUF4124)
MKKLAVIFSACIFVSMSVTAEIYKCIDSSGKTQYGDKPCKGESSIFTPKAGPKADKNIEERREKTQRLLRAYREEYAQEKQKTAELKAEKEKRVENCRRARNRYQQVTSAGRVYRIDKDGNQTDFTDEERADAAASAMAGIKQWCG